MKEDSLGDRIKFNYEDRAKTYLTRRTPVIIRLDGRAFHTFTRGCQKPYDDTIMESMIFTSDYLVKNIQGAKISYTQSDEISILVTDYDELDSNAWFDNGVQKICSNSASMASVNFTLRYNDFHRGYNYEGKLWRNAFFDSRCFNIPKEEVINYFRWRFIDWKRNSIAMAVQSEFSHKQLHGKSRSQQLEMLLETGIDWNEFNDQIKFGTTILKTGGGFQNYAFDWMNDEHLLDEVKKLF